MGAFLSNGSSNDQQQNPQQQHSPEQHQHQQIEEEEDGGSGIRSRLRRRRRRNSSEDRRRYSRRRRTDVNSFVESGQPDQQVDRSLPQGRIEIEDGDGVDTSTEHVDGMSRASASSQILLRQTIEQVIYNILEEQEYSRQHHGGDSQVGQESGSNNSLIQVFFFSGTFRVQLQRPPNAPNDPSSDSSHSAPSRFAISQIASSRNGETQEIIDYSSMRNFMARNSPQNREVERQWLSEGTLRTLLRTTLANEQQQQQEQEQAQLQPESGEFPIIDLPLVMLGTPDHAPRSESSTGWIMYVIGGGSTGEVISQITDRSRSTNTIPTVIGSEGRLLTMFRPENVAPSIEETIIVSNLGSLLSESSPSTSTTAGNTVNNLQNNVLAGLPISDERTAAISQNRSVGILLAAILSGLYESPAGDGILNLLLSSSSSSSSRATGGGGEDEMGSERDTYDLLWRLAGMLGPAIPRNVPMDLIDQNLPCFTYSRFKKELAGCTEGTTTTMLMQSCPVCLVDYEDETDLRILPCSHYFHKECIDTWLCQHVNNCPLCRKPAVKTTSFSPASSHSTISDNIQSLL